VVDVLIEHGLVVTMNASRRVLADGAIAIRGSRIAAVGPTSELRRRYVARQTIDASRSVVVPGFVNAHLHASTEPITRGLVPDDTPFEENVFSWLSPLAATLTEEDEYLSAQLGALECLKSGTTCFVEAGTGWHLDATVEALLKVGIRARVGRRTWDRPSSPEKFRQTTDEAVGNLHGTVSRHRSHDDGRIRGWAVLVGHTTCSDTLWRAARALADEYRTGLAFHMSPAASDPEGFLAEHGSRPVEHLHSLGVLGPDAMLAHGVHLDDHEVSLLAETACNVAHCPTTALKVAYGVTQIGKMPEMDAAGVNLCIGTDGCNSSNYSDMYRAAYLVAGLFKEARRDPSVFPAHRVLEMATIGGARGLLAEDEIGSIETGKRADLVLHDRDRPEWTPLHDVVNQLVYSADGRSVHTVFVDGRRVVDGYRATWIDEEDLYTKAHHAAQSILRRVHLPAVRPWRRTPSRPG
jgi:cytosine/adenosine deaminase-related metal-dependent hydrolase